VADKLRLFVAVDVDERVRTQVARVENALRPVVSGVKWVEPELCHITLKFLGYVPEEQVPAIAEACRRTAMVGQPFDMGFRGVGAFPRLRNARVLWMGLERGEALLAALAATLERELAPLGFAPEQRPFSPHLTLGRFKAPPGQGLEEAVRPFEHQRFGTVRVDSLRLMRSILSPAGPTYSVVEVFPLG